MPDRPTDIPGQLGRRRAKEGERRSRRRAAWARAARRRRARAKACEAVAGVTYTGAVLDLLVRTGWLDERAAGDRRAVGLAISRLLADSAK
jgi:hypothetical protein